MFFRCKKALRRSFSDEISEIRTCTVKLFICSQISVILILPSGANSVFLSFRRTAKNKLSRPCTKVFSAVSARTEISEDVCPVVLPVLCAHRFLVCRHVCLIQALPFRQELFLFPIFRKSFFERKVFMENQTENTRVAVISILLESSNDAEKVNALLHEYGAYIIGRMGLPYPKSTSISSAWHSTHRRTKSTRFPASLAVFPVFLPRLLIRIYKIGRKESSCIINCRLMPRNSLVTRKF